MASVPAAQAVPGDARSVRARRSVLATAADGAQLVSPSGMASGLTRSGPRVGQRLLALVSVCAPPCTHPMTAPMRSAETPWAPASSSADAAARAARRPTRSMRRALALPEAGSRGLVDALDRERRDSGRPSMTMRGAPECTGQQRAPERSALLPSGLTMPRPVITTRGLMRVMLSRTARAGRASGPAGCGYRGRNPATPSPRRHSCPPTADCAMTGETDPGECSPRPCQTRSMPTLTTSALGIVRLHSWHACSTDSGDPPIPFVYDDVSAVAGSREIGTPRLDRRFCRRVKCSVQVRAGSAGRVPRVERHRQRGPRNPGSAICTARAARVHAALQPGACAGPSRAVFIVAACGSTWPCS